MKKLPKNIKEKEIKEAIKMCKFEIAEWQKFLKICENKLKSNLSRLTTAGKAGDLKLKITKIMK